MSNYTMRIWTNGDGDFVDTDFATLPALYNTVFKNWQADNIDTGSLNEGYDLTSGYAVYDNDTGLCINSINPGMVGLDKTQAWIPFEPKANYP
jgi:hypothetical protein